MFNVRPRVKVVTATQLSRGFTLLTVSHMRSLLGVNIQPSSIKNAGRGLFTLENRSPGDVILEYQGEIIDKKELDRRYSSSNFLAVYTLEVSSDCFIDSACWRSIRAYANGSCKVIKPNAA